MEQTPDITNPCYNEHIFSGRLALHYVRVPLDSHFIVFPHSGFTVPLKLAEFSHAHWLRAIINSWSTLIDHITCTQYKAILENVF